MKRKIEDLVNWVPVWERHKELITRVFFVVMLCFWGIFWFSTVDIVPATAEDYKPLVDIAETIQQEPSLLLEYEWTDGRNNGILTIAFENAECKVIAQYDKDFGLLSTTKEDKALPFFRGMIGITILSIFLTLIPTALFFGVTSTTVDRKKEIKSRICEEESEQEDGEEEQE